tara:strand:- start:131 stop:319 length:189 start_codon:yes stop_codon:yes gene_type:complete
MKVNWINSWNSYNKKEKYELNFRLGTVDVLQVHVCPCPACDKKKKKPCPRFRFMILNFGFEF